MGLQFEKWHGTGNDFILVSYKVVSEFTSDIGKLSTRMCDRHFGVGADGLITVGKSDKAKFKVRMWNPDGSESGMCGNGLRCVGAQLLHNGIVDSSEALLIETGKGIVTLDFPDPPEWVEEHEYWVRVDLGEPILKAKEIPLRADLPSPVVNMPLRVKGIETDLSFTAVGMGNPHAVVFVEDVDSVPLAEWGPLIEGWDEIFPERVNVEFVQVINREHVKMRVWERGAGATLSCGSGTAAVQVACHLTGRGSERLRVDVPGGKLLTEYTSDGRVMLSGPAVRVFSGEWFL